VFDPKFKIFETMFETGFKIKKKISLSFWPEGPAQQQVEATHRIS
jgi:hypothetical protein